MMKPFLFVCLFAVASTASAQSFPPDPAADAQAKIDAAAADLATQKTRGLGMAAELPGLQQDAIDLLYVPGAQTAAMTCHELLQEANTLVTNALQNVQNGEAHIDTAEGKHLIGDYTAAEIYADSAQQSADAAKTMLDQAASKIQSAKDILSDWEGW